MNIFGDFVLPETKVETKVVIHRLTVEVNGKEVSFPDVEPALVDNRTLVPLRGVFEAMGYNLNWDDSTRTAFMEYHSVNGYNENFRKVAVKIGEKTFTVEREGQHKGVTTVTPDVPQKIVNDRFMLPLRAIAEATGATVGWEQETKTVIITTAKDLEKPKTDGSVFEKKWSYDEKFHSFREVQPTIYTNFNEGEIGTGTFGKFYIPQVDDYIYFGMTQAEVESVMGKAWKTPDLTISKVTYKVHLYTYNTDDEYADYGLAYGGGILRYFEIIGRSERGVYRYNTGIKAMDIELGKTKHVQLTDTKDKDGRGIITTTGLTWKGRDYFSSVRPESGEMATLIAFVNDKGSPAVYVSFIAIYGSPDNSIAGIYPFLDK